MFNLDILNCAYLLQQRVDHKVVALRNRSGMGSHTHFEERAAGEGLGSGEGQVPLRA